MEILGILLRDAFSEVFNPPMLLYPAEQRDDLKSSSYNVWSAIIRSTVWLPNSHNAKLIDWEIACIDLRTE